MKLSLNDTMLKILILLGFISIFVNLITDAKSRETSWMEGFTIIIAVLISAGFSAINDYQKEKKFLELDVEFYKTKKVKFFLLFIDKAILTKIINVFFSIKNKGTNL